MPPIITVLSPSQRVAFKVAAAQHLERIRENHAASASCQNPASPASLTRSPSNHTSETLRTSSPVRLSIQHASIPSRDLSPSAFPGAYVPYLCSLALASAGRAEESYRCLQEAATSLEPVTTSNHARARLHHSIGTHTHLLHGVLKLQGVATGSSYGPSAQAVQDLIIQLLLQQPYESRLYLALVLQYAAADSWDVAATLLKTALKMVPDWTEGGVMLGCDRKLSRLPCRAQ
jgi:hypothetical protein